MSLTYVVTAAAETEGVELNPYLVGAVILLVWLALMAALLAFGGGREHS